MYLAEIHGKLSRENENKEDILTSNVFSFFKYSNRIVFLRLFLQSLGLIISCEEVKDAEFQFWPSYPDGTQPDLVINVGKYYLLFEAKYHSGFGQETPILKHQLEREAEGGYLEAQNQEKEFRIIAVTADYYSNTEVHDKLPKKYHPYLIWRNWQSIALLLFQILQQAPPIPPETRLFAEDLYSLFLKKNLRNYEGIRILSKLSRMHDWTGNIFFEARTASYRGDFLGFLPVLKVLKPIRSMSGKLFYSHKARYSGFFEKSGLEQIQPVGHIFYLGKTINE